MISVIITSQKYTKLPSFVRSNINLLILFNLVKLDIKVIKEQLIYNDIIDFGDILKFVFKDGSNTNFLIYNIDTNTYYKNFDKILS